MFSATRALLAILAFGTFTAWAQTVSPQSACAASIVWPVYREVFNWSYDDESLFDFTMTYDIPACTEPSIVPSLTFKLTDLAGGVIWLGELQQPARDRNTLYSQYTITRGEMARMARDTGESDWSLDISMGPRRGSASATFYFAIAAPTEPAPPVASGAIARRRVTPEEQHRFDCPMGQTSCWTGERQDYACMDTSSDVTACGRCPYGPGSDDVDSDCTAIDGADDVQCQNSKCVVNACQRGFQLSLDKTKCVDARKRSTVRSLHK